MRRPGFLSAPALCWVLFALPLAAADPPLPGPVALRLNGSRFRAGDMLDLTFRFPAGVEVDEWEAYLSLDGGETWPVRLAEDQDPGSARLVVCLPDLPTAAARILIRAGGEDGPGEAGRFERDVAVSEIFRIDGGDVPHRSPPRPDGGRLPRRGDSVHIEWVVDEIRPGEAFPVRLPVGLSGGGPAVDADDDSDQEIVVPAAPGSLEAGPDATNRPPARVRPEPPARAVSAFRGTTPPPLRR
jgi:hypothetical protein